MNQTLKLELNINELNTVMAGLGKLPYEQCYAVVEAIRQQVAPQLQDNSGGSGAMGPGSEQ